jgi:molybdate transport system ATP-binding protein
LRRQLTSAGAFLSLRDATFRVGDRLIFPNTNWTFARDEHWAVLGPNGSGKSLFADALRGLVPVVHGELNYHFRPPEGMIPEEVIGHVSFEDRRLHIHGAVAQSRWNSIEEESALRVGDVLSYERVMEINPFEVTENHERDRRRFDHALRRAIRLFRIDPFLDRTLLSLSNGEQQRVQLAHALCRPLHLLILDDPFVCLDQSSRDDVHVLLEKLMSTSLRILLITPRIDDLPRSISHVLRVDGCQIIASGKRAEYRGCKRLIGPISHIGPIPSNNCSTRATPLVALRNVTVRYGSATILQNFNWTVLPGESWALLGPNGSGKTTLLSLIQGDNPQAYMNHVEIFGRRRGTGESIWELKRQIGWVSPELHLHFNQSMTCFEVVASGFHETIGLFEPLTALQRKTARHWLKRFEMPEFVRKPLFELSLGQQRMVLLARALVKKPKLLILDEPCQGLDTAHRQLFLGTLDKLLRGQTETAIYVTHRPDEIPRSIKRVLRLSKPKSSSS